MKTLLSLALFLMIGTGVFAGMGWHVTIHNLTANNVTISPAGSDNWSQFDFRETQTMGPNETRVFYTEDEFYYGPDGPVAGWVAIDIDFGYGSERVEMWDDSHPYSATRNISYVVISYPFYYVGIIGTTSDYITTDMNGNVSVMYATLNLLPPTGNAHVPVAHDVSGDGRTDVAMVSDDTWHFFLSSREFAHSSSYDLDKSGTPLLADLDGDGLADPVVVDHTGAWHVWRSSEGYALSGPHDLGVPGTPLAADFDGDGKADPAFYYASQGAWIVFCSGSGYQAVSFTLGGSGARPVPADYDGDNKADPAVYDSNSGTWMVAGSASSYALLTASLGGADCAPAPEDFDGDGRADPAVYSATLGKWGVLHSQSNYRLGLIEQGGADCIPVPGSYHSASHANYAVYHITSNSWQVANDNYIPRPIRGVFYPIYNDSFPAYAPANLRTGELAKLNLVFISFAHVYGSSDSTNHFYPNLEKPASPDNVILAYENARNGSVPLTNGDYDYDRIKQIVDAVHTNGGKVLISLGYGNDWEGISQDYHTTNSMFAESMATFLATNNLDGFDIDFESVSGISAEDFAAVCGQLREALGNRYILSITPYWDSTSLISQEAITNFDLVNSQSYYDDWQSYYENWHNLQVPDSKLTFGMTLDNNRGTHDYQGLVGYWTSNPTLGGVFIWSMTDAEGHTPSTYDAIDYMFDNVHY